MCYSNCPFERLSTAECGSPKKNSLSLKAHCCTDFICEQCNERRTEEEAGVEVGYCQECEEKNKQDEEDFDIDFSDFVDDKALTEVIALSDAFDSQIK